MADKGPGITSAAIMGGFLCLGLVFFAIAAAIVLSLIPTFTANHSQQGYGSEYALDALLLKFLYQNVSALFNGTTIGNSSDLSLRCTQYLQKIGIKNVRGCVLLNGLGYGPYNTSTNSRRRRRATEVGAYAKYTARVFYSVTCGTNGDKNKTENSTTVSSCVNQTLAGCNSLNNDVSTSFSLWSAAGLILEMFGWDGVFRQIPIDTLYGVPRPIAVAIARNLPGISSSDISSLQRGCRYVGSLPLSTIDAIIAGQSVTNYTTDATTAPSG